MGLIQQFPWPDTSLLTSALKMEAIFFSETLLYRQNTTRYNNQEYRQYIHITVKNKSQRTMSVASMSPTHPYRMISIYELTIRETFLYLHLKIDLGFRDYAT
jgi:hypothetical protein